MPGYSLHFHDGSQTFIDDDGFDASTEAMAISEARKAAWALICDLRHEIRDWSKWHVELQDERGVRLVVLPSTAQWMRQQVTMRALGERDFRLGD